MKQLIIISQQERRLKVSLRRPDCCKIRFLLLPNFGCSFKAWKRFESVLGSRITEHFNSSYLWFELQKWKRFLRRNKDSNRGNEPSSENKRILTFGTNYFRQKCSSTCLVKAHHSYGANLQMIKVPQILLKKFVKNVILQQAKVVQTLAPTHTHRFSTIVFRIFCLFVTLRVWRVIHFELDDDDATAAT